MSNLMKGHKSMGHVASSFAKPRVAPRRGTPLPDEIRRDAEELFGEDFSDVRVIVSDAAPKIGAIAFTSGSEIHIAPGVYRPGTEATRALLGHELAHVVQQRRGRATNPHGYGVAVVRDQGLEAEADRMGRALQMMQQGKKKKKEADPVLANLLRKLSIDFWSEGRTKTLYSYFHPGKQGPHTVAHVWLEDRVGKLTWDRLGEFFRDVVATPDDAAAMFFNEAPEGFPEKNWEAVTSWLIGYRELYLEIANRLAGDESPQERGRVAKLMCAILELSPYATYGWTGGGVSHRSTRGKGESKLKSLAQNQDMGGHPTRPADAAAYYRALGEFTGEDFRVPKSQRDGGMGDAPDPKKKVKLS